MKKKKKRKNLETTKNTIFILNIKLFFIEWAKEGSEILFYNLVTRKENYFISEQNQKNHRIILQFLAKFKKIKNKMRRKRINL